MIFTKTFVIKRKIVEERKKERGRRWNLKWKQGSGQVQTTWRCGTMLEMRPSHVTGWKEEGWEASTSYTEVFVPLSFCLSSPARPSHLGTLGRIAWHDRQESHKHAHTPIKERKRERERERRLARGKTKKGQMVDRVFSRGHSNAFFKRLTTSVECFVSSSYVRTL